MTTKHTQHNAPNLTSDCLIRNAWPQDILKDQWSPALTIKTALLSLQALLCSAEPNDPQVGTIGKSTFKGVEVLSLCG